LEAEGERETEENRVEEERREEKGRKAEYRTPKADHHLSHPPVRNHHQHLHDATVEREERC
jgi:hypothetical protein